MLIKAYTRGFSYCIVCEQEHTCTQVFANLVILMKVYEVEHENRCEWFSLTYVTSQTTTAW